MSAAGLGEVVQVALRLDDHQVHVQRQPGAAPGSLHQQRSDGDVGHEAAVHHVHVDAVRPRLVHLGDLLSENAEVRGENGGENPDSAGAHLDRTFLSCAALMVRPALKTVLAHGPPPSGIHPPTAARSLSKASEKSRTPSSNSLSVISSMDTPARSSASMVSAAASTSSPRLFRIFP